MGTAFVAFASRDPLIVDTILDACTDATSHSVQYVPWNKLDPSGQPVDRSVYSWLEEADFLVADISNINDNVTFEIAVALGMGKPVRLIRYSHSDWDQVLSIGLLHNLGHDSYMNRRDLISILSKPAPPITGWSLPKPNYAQPLYFIQPSQTDDAFVSLFSAVKKKSRLRFRNFNPREIDRLTASEAFAQVMSSFGVVATWHPSDAPHADRQNQRAAFVIGLARGADLPLRLFATPDQRLPLDLDELASRWADSTDLTAIIGDLRTEIDQVMVDPGEPEERVQGLLEQINCGDPAAENEMAELAEYFLETDEFKAALDGNLNVLTGRKGSGKTAIFIRLRDRVRSNKNNLVIDLQPEGYQLLKFKEFVVDKLGYASRKEFLAAFWEYIVWLEIAYKILEKDNIRAQRDSALLERYQHLERAFLSRVDTGSGDFSERLRRLTDGIVRRFEGAHTDETLLESSRSLEIVYGKDIAGIRDSVLEYLKIKGTVFFLFDNLDRIWKPGGFSGDDAIIIGGLIESLQEISRKFRRHGSPFQWSVFIRSDIYEFVVKSMADYGKLSADSVEWNDDELLWKMFQRRVTHGVQGAPVDWAEFWNRISVQLVGGASTESFLVESSLMRPRYLIRLFETARRRAVMFGRERIDETDYKSALQELGWQVMEDFDRELSDIVPTAEELLFELAHLGPNLSLEQLKEVIGRRVDTEQLLEATIDVLIWTGCIGVETDKGPIYISDCGYKRQYMKAMIAGKQGRAIIFHPTLVAVIAA